MLLMARRSAAFDGDLGPSRLVINLHNDTDLLSKILEVLFEGLHDAELDLDEALDGIELVPTPSTSPRTGPWSAVNTIVLALLTGTIRGYPP